MDDAACRIVDGFADDRVRHTAALQFGLNLPGPPVACREAVLRELGWSTTETPPTGHCHRC